jgi:hemagglutinin/hemolysin-like protein
VWVHNAECCDLGIGEINPRTGHKVLASHKIEAGSNSDYIIEATKPSAKGKLVNTKTQYYENPGHHDPKGGGNVGYNSTKSVLPENHIELWNKSVIVKSDPKNRWAVETKNSKTIYHRFQDDGNGNFHWNGSTDGKTARGEARAIKIDDVPKELKR